MASLKAEIKDLERDIKSRESHNAKIRADIERIGATPTADELAYARRQISDLERDIATAEQDIKQTAGAEQITQAEIDKLLEA